MERVRDAFISLLRSGLWERDPVAEGFQRLSDERWKEVFRLSERQTVTGIVFDGICRLPEDLQPSPSLFAQWVVAVDRIERRNERMNDVLRDLVKLFVGNGLNPVLQKGQGIAALYPVPSHRECGDIDLYFPEGLSLRQAHRPDKKAPRPGKMPQQAEKTDQWSYTELFKTLEKTENDMAVILVKSRGAKVGRMPDGSQSYEWQGVEIEQHPTIVDLCSPTSRLWLHELDEAPGFVTSPLAKGLRVPSPELNALLLNTHILKHALGKGVGLRQMCDLAMAYHRMSEEKCTEERGERIFSLYRRSWILAWSRLLHSFLVDVIGLPKEELPYPEKIVSSAPLLRIVEEGGNFGQYRSGGSGVLTDRERKFRTAGMFLKRAGFSLRFAPQEAFWTFMELVRGQFKK